jgi:DNA-binding transcriptional LysR family regulator
LSEQKDVLMQLDIRGQHFSQLRAFVAIAESRSFVRAAERLGICSSSLSQTIRLLEQRVRVRLFNRTTRSVSLTRAGEMLLQRIQPAFVEISRALGDLTDFADRACGTVRLHSCGLATSLYIRPRIAQFSELFPDIVLEIIADQAFTDFVRGGYDAAIRPADSIDEDMIAVKIGPDIQHVAVASPQYIQRYGRPSMPEALGRYRCIRWRAPGRTASHWHFCRNNTRLEIPVAGPLVSDERSLILHAALDGVGIAYLTSIEVATYIAAGDLIPLLETWSPPVDAYKLCYPTPRQMPHALRAVVNFLRRSQSYFDVPSIESVPIQEEPPPFEDVV